MLAPVHESLLTPSQIQVLSMDKYCSKDYHLPTICFAYGLFAYVRSCGKISVLGCTIVKSYELNLTQTLASIVKYARKLHA